MMTNLLLIRADANATIGTGHVMRCIALAHAWQQAGGTVVIASRALPEPLVSRLTAESIAITAISATTVNDDISQTIAAAREHQAACVVLDGYHFGAQHQRAIREAGFRQLVIDDYGHADEYCADFVLNQNISASRQHYSNRTPETTLLLGARYALLRREFIEHENTPHQIPEVATKILVTMGGADAENVTGSVLQMLSSVANNGWHVKVVVGPANPNFAALQTLAANAHFKLELLCSPAMPELMQWADMAISATGTTCWELMFMQVPFVGIAFADNQRAIASKLQDEGIAPTFQWGSDCNSFVASISELAASAQLRCEHVASGRSRVDGIGAERVVAALACPLTLSSATMNECRLVWQWANDAEVRAVSFDSRPITWNDHRAWYAAQISDPNTCFYIARNTSREPIGQVRFAIRGDAATISVSLGPQNQGKGYGSTLISVASARLFSENPSVVCIDAYIKCDNRKSVAAFARSGFVAAGTSTIKTLPALHYVLYRNRYDQA